MLNQRVRRFAPTPRGILAGLFVVLAGTYAVRSALVTAYVDGSVEDAATIWEEHPDVLAALSEAAIAEAAVQQTALGPEASDRITKLAELAPLSWEPFLAAGAVALSEGRHRRAEQLLLAARTRAPRSTATRYLLAEIYWREDRIGPALQELAAVRRLRQALTPPLVAGLAEFVRREGPIPEVREILRSDPQLQSALLSALASDHTNADLILSLAGSPGGSDTTPRWVQQLLSSLVGAGEYIKAHKLWLQFASAADSQGDGWAFARSESDSPFKWQFTENSAGSAVPAGDDLEVFYSGRESINFASKLVLLPPGSYAIRMLVSGSPPSDESIRWSVTCLPGDEKATDIPVMKSGRVSARFQIPQACVAQRFELQGLAQTVPETATFSISELRIARGQTQ